MGPLEALAVLAAGVAAGGINTVVGSGSLITFPTLLAVGVPPVVANVSNTVGLVPGALTGTLGYRAELRGQRARLVRLGVASAVGALVGGLLLLLLPPEAFRFIVIVLIVVAIVLVIVQPRLNAWMASRRESSRRHGGPWLWLGVLGSGIYGGYFGAAQGVMLIGLLGVFLDDDLQRINAAKNVLAGLVNAVAAALFILLAEVDWRAALLIAVGAAAGGALGARLGRRLSPTALRTVIVCVGLFAIVQLAMG
ncbi:sulfite exporter TauE/SafE family protein [Rhizohabitans arisaemae]|uniref:sulfite exporter TauE/SafE family protein n=1 Tax=Rhizohabitans arisaemae TaxID=2720610 RepID=UPI0024B04207|nr:sulfite exporter TauE/SafE family protein [Rhizohabitans arisaemae]